MTIHQPLCYSRSIRISLLVLVCISTPAFGQLDTVKLSSDELFTIAREKAFEGKREEARALCRVVTKRSPCYNDVRILLGSTRAWDGRRDEARKELLIVLDLNPENKDALDALMDVELWDERFEEAYQIANRGLRLYPNEESFLLKKARALKNLQRHDEALFVLFQLEEVAFYPKIIDGGYCYLSYGYSNSDLFPKHRFGLEAYAKLPKSFEASLGLRHLAFDGGGNITIYTGSLGYYFKSYWISVKPYITPNDGSVSVSFNTTIRWYLLDA